MPAVDHVASPHTVSKAATHVALTRVADVGKCPQINRELELKGVTIAKLPSLVVLQDGKPVATREGFINEADLATFLDSVLESTSTAAVPDVECNPWFEDFLASTKSTLAPGVEAVSDYLSMWPSAGQPVGRSRDDPQEVW